MPPAMESSFPHTIINNFNISEDLLETIAIQHLLSALHNLEFIHFPRWAFKEHSPIIVKLQANSHKLQCVHQPMLWKLLIERRLYDRWGSTIGVGESYFYQEWITAYMHSDYICRFINILGEAVRLLIGRRWLEIIRIFYSGRLFTMPSRHD